MDLPSPGQPGKGRPSWRPVRRLGVLSLPTGVPLDPGVAVTVLVVVGSAVSCPSPSRGATVTVGSATAPRSSSTVGWAAVPMPAPPPLTKIPLVVAVPAPTTTTTAAAAGNCARRPVLRRLRSPTPVSRSGSGARSAAPAAPPPDLLPSSCRPSARLRSHMRPLSSHNGPDPERGERPERLAAYGSPRNAEDCGDLVIRQVLVVPPDQHGLLPPGRRG